MARATAIMLTLHADEETDPAAWYQLPDDEARYASFDAGQWHGVIGVLHGDLDDGEVIYAGQDILDGPSGPSDAPGILEDLLREELAALTGKLQDLDAAYEHLRPYVPSLETVMPQEGQSVMLSAAQITAGAEEATHHPQAQILIGGQPVDVDAGIADVMQQLNDDGLRTVQSCEDNDGHRVWVAFQNSEQADRFLAQAGLADVAEIETSAERASRASRRGDQPESRVSVEQLDWGLAQPVSVRFPQAMLADVRAALGLD